MKSTTGKRSRSSSSSSNGAVSRERLYELLGDAILLPSDARTKVPTWNGTPYPWKDISYADTQSIHYVKRLDAAIVKGNICVRCGPTSRGWLAAIDIDNAEAATNFLKANPRFKKTFTTKGKRGCHFWFYVAGDFPQAKA